MKGQTVYTLPLLILMGLLVACSTPGPGQPLLPATPLLFQCGMMSVVFRPNTDGTADMRINNQAWHLHQVRGGSGGRYETASEPTTMFWDKGDRALLRLDNNLQSQCMQIDPDDHYMARGNEPVWMIHLSGSNLGLISDYGNQTILATITVDEDDTEHRHITAHDGNERLTVELIKQACRDDMSGEPFPHRVTVLLSNEQLRGCGGIRTVSTEPVEGITWTLEELDQHGIIERSQITLSMTKDGHISGNSGCNNYMSRYQREGGQLLIKPRIGVTMMACPAETLMVQEQRYLDILGRMDRLEVGAAGTLILSNDRGVRLVFRRAE